MRLSTVFQLFLYVGFFNANSYAQLTIPKLNQKSLSSNYGHLKLSESFIDDLLPSLEPTLDGVACTLSSHTATQVLRLRRAFNLVLTQELLNTRPTRPGRREPPNAKSASLADSLVELFRIAFRNAPEATRVLLKKVGLLLLRVDLAEVLETRTIGELFQESLSTADGRPIPELTVLIEAINRCEDRECAFDEPTPADSFFNRLDRFFHLPEIIESGGKGFFNDAVLSLTSSESGREYLVALGMNLQPAEDGSEGEIETKLRLFTQPLIYPVSKKLLEEMVTGDTLDWLYTLIYCGIGQVVPIIGFFN